MQPTKKKKAWNIKCQIFWIFLPLERLWRTFNVYVSVRFLQKENYLVFFACLYNNVMLLITVIHTENRVSWYYFHDTELRCMLFWEIIIRMIVSLLQMILIMLITCICKVKLNDPHTDIACIYRYYKRKFPHYNYMHQRNDGSTKSFEWIHMNSNIKTKRYECRLACT